MNNLASSQPRSLRVFRVGILGASPEELSTINRVCSVTQYRTRRYEPVRLPLTLSKIPKDIDILILGQGEGDLASMPAHHLNGELPLIRMVRNMPPGIESQGYTVKTPLNPAKFLRVLDQYTIKELNYFPEFEIGHETQQIRGDTLAGLRMLNKVAASQGAVKSTFTRNKALVVDDSLPVRRQMEIEFQLMRQQADVVSSAEAAMLAVNSNRYSIIFLDVVMPGMDGYAACKKIKRSPLNRDTPIIMLTSRSSSFDKFKGTLAGCDAYLVKPINHNEFEQVFKQYAVKEKPSHGESVNARK